MSNEKAATGTQQHCGQDAAVAADGAPRRVEGTSPIESDIAKLAVPGAAAGAIPDPDLDQVVAADQAKGDVEKAAGDSPAPATDIEHLPVDDDPRLWSAARKWGILAIVSFGALVPTMAGTMFFPAIEDLRRELGATDTEISLSVSLFILAQGLFPLIWSPVSELIGRKPCFVSAMAFFTIMTGFTSIAKNMATVIVLRSLAAGGSSVTLAVAAGTLADIYETEERGVKVGIYYSVPITGPALAPIIGGLVTEAAGWKAVFWFLAAAGAVSTIAYAFLKETFRTERSAAWRKARADAIKKAEKAERAHNNQTSSSHSHHLWHLSRKDRHEESSQETAPAAATETGSVGHGAQSPGDDIAHQPLQAPDYHLPSEEHTATTSTTTTTTTAAPTPKRQATTTFPVDTDGQGGRAPRPSPAIARRASLTRVVSHRSIQAAGRVKTRDGQEIKFKPSLRDVSPLGSATYVLSQPHNIAALIYSGCAFAAQYSLTFTATTTFTAAPYNYSPVLIGCVLLSLGVGGMIGSIVGGRISDWRLSQVLKRTGKKAAPEERLRTILIPMVLVIPAYVGYGWATQYHTNIAAPIVILVILGYAQIHCYSVDLSYLVDSNPGRSSGAVAVNSAFRGILAFASAEASSPLLKSVNNGPLQTGWAVIISFTVVLLFLAESRGGQWRDEEWRWPRLWRASQWKRDRVGGSRSIKEKQRTLP